MTIAAFAEDVLDSNLIIYHTIGGPGASTSVVQVESGAESRNANQKTMLGIWEYGERNMLPDDFKNLQKFFRARNGKTQGFRFLDPGNHTDDGTGALVQIDGTHWQMIKNFSSGGVTAYQKITKLIEDTIEIQGGGGYDYEITTGIVTENYGPDPTGWTGGFHTPVRFDADRIRFEFIAADIGPGGGRVKNAYFHVYSLPIIELRQL